MLTERQRLVRVSYGRRLGRRLGTKCFGCLLPALSISASSEMTKSPKRQKSIFLSLLLLEGSRACCDLSAREALRNCCAFTKCSHPASPSRCRRNILLDSDALRPSDGSGGAWKPAQEPGFPRYRQEARCRAGTEERAQKEVPGQWRWVGQQELGTGPSLIFLM